MKLTKDNFTMSLFTKDRYEPLRACIDSFTSTAPEGTSVVVLEDQPKGRFRNSGLIPEYKILHVVEIPKKSSCAHLWNLCYLLSGTRYVMVTQDDIIFNSNKWLLMAEEKLDEGYECILLYNWGAFILDKKVLPKLGYADERFKGGCHEDADLSLRAREKESIKLCNLTGPLDHRGTSGADISHSPNYYSSACWDASYNEKFFHQKWGASFDSLLRQNPRKPLIEDVDWYPALTDMWRD